MAAQTMIPEDEVRAALAAIGAMILMGTMVQDELADRESRLVPSHADASRGSAGVATGVKAEADRASRLISSD